LFLQDILLDSSTKRAPPSMSDMAIFRQPIAESSPAANRTCGSLVLTSPPCRHPRPLALCEP
jgi:hypothetical protein